MHPNNGNADAPRAGLTATEPPATQPSRDDAIRLMRGGLAKAMRDVAASCVMPICWITAPDRRIFNAGSKGRTSRARLRSAACAARNRILIGLRCGVIPAKKPMRRRLLEDTFAEL